MSQAGNVITLVFSRDRAMQLDAMLRSFLLHCQDASRTEITVIYLATDMIHREQYDQLRVEYAGNASIHFHPERNFRGDVLGILGDEVLSGRLAQCYRWTVVLGWRFYRLSALFLSRRQPTFVLFLVDDNIFVSDFMLRTAHGALAENADALGFSLRLGENTRYCYMLDHKQALPKFTQFSPSILKYDWTKGEYDFNYPLEVSSSLYRAADILPLINRLPFSNPNTLEKHLARLASLFQEKMPALLTFQKSVTFCNPVNKLQSGHTNRAGDQNDYSSRGLAEKFKAGYRIDINAYTDFVPNSCHQETPLYFRQNEGAG